MSDDILNQEIRRFLKKVGITSQREIERAIAAARQRGTLREGQPLSATMTLRIADLDLELAIDGEITPE